MPWSLRSLNFSQIKRKTLNSHKTLFFTQIFLSLSLFIQVFEYIKIAKVIEHKDHPWSWSLVRQDFLFLPKWIFLFLDKLFSSHIKNYLIFHLLCLIAFTLHFSKITLAILVFNQLLLNIRFRGNFNGGSDYMTVVVLMGLLFTRPTKLHSNQLDWGFAYIAFQVILSYFIAGFIKLRNADWRSGHALSVFLQLTNYRIPNNLKSLSSNSLFHQLFSWIVMVWEVGIIVAMLNPQWMLAYLILALIFHLGNFVFFGLNRFVFAWLASYPALYFTHLQIFN